MSRLVLYCARVLARCPAPRPASAPGSDMGDGPPAAAANTSPILRSRSNRRLSSRSNLRGEMRAFGLQRHADEAVSHMSHPLDSRQLRAFATLARKGSFTLAAKELFLSQSAVSHSMKALEQDVGCRLLDRLGKRVILTQAGEQLLHHAETILQEMSLARASLEQLGKWGRAKLRIGATATACEHILPGVLRELK